jgi:hypothetical protein
VQGRYASFMGPSHLSPDEIRAAAAAHRELGPEYGDAVVESFLEKIDKEVGARIEARLANTQSVRRRRLDPEELNRRRSLLKGMTFGSIAAGVPLTAICFLLNPNPRTEQGAIITGILILAIYTVVAIWLRPPSRGG